MAKNSFRKKCLSELKKLSYGKRKKGSAKIVSVLQKLIKKRGYKRVLAYIPLKHEPDITNLFKMLNVNFSVPFMEGKSFKMVKYRLPLKKGRFGIKEPCNSFERILKIDLAIVPVIGVDGSFRRIGFGKGMYDRFFEKIEPKPFVVFVELKNCFLKQLICNEYDVVGDMYITPNKILIRGEIDVDRIGSRKFGCSCWSRGRFFYSKKGWEKQV
jgi:5-formyltetrahydrofolate cyclo-ligase